MENDTFDLTCQTSGYPTPTLFWMKNEEIISTNTSLSIERVDAEDSGLYHCIVENALGKKWNMFELMVHCKYNLKRVLKEHSYKFVVLSLKRSC